MKSALKTVTTAERTGRWVQSILTTQRRRLVAAFWEFSQSGSTDSVLSIHHAGNEDRLLASCELQERQRITSLRVAMPDGSVPFRLPFRDGEFDWVFCDGTIEHMGDSERQYELLCELARVARRGVFLTTPNRLHPIEFHTGVPFLHWLPRNWWEKLGPVKPDPLLCLLDGPALYRMAERLPGKPRHDVGHKRVYGLKAHFFLMIEKAAPGAGDDKAGGG